MFYPHTVVCWKSLDPATTCTSHHVVVVVVKSPGEKLTTASTHAEYTHETMPAARWQTRFLAGLDRVQEVDCPDSCSVPGTNIVSENGVMFVLAHMYSHTLSMRIALMFYVLKHTHNTHVCQDNMMFVPFGGIIFLLTYFLIPKFWFGE